MTFMSCDSDDNFEFENDYLKTITHYIKLLIIVYSSVVHNGARGPKWALWGFSLGSFKIIFS